jgi:hypothetical protein
MNSWIETGLDMIASRYGNQPSTAGYICQVAKRHNLNTAGSQAVDTPKPFAALRITAISSEIQNIHDLSGHKLYIRRKRSFSKAPDEGRDSVS